MQKREIEKVLKGFDNCVRKLFERFFDYLMISDYEFVSSKYENYEEMLEALLSLLECGWQFDRDKAREVLKQIEAIPLKA
jgi:hypothetical protein